MRLPDKERDLLALALQLIEQCLVSQSQRASAYQQYGSWIETGQAAGGDPATANLLYGHTDRLAAHLFSPIELRFNFASKNKYPGDILSQLEASERVLNDEWNTNNIDLLFGSAVLQSVRYGSCFIKQIVNQHYDADHEKWVFDKITGRLVMPWQFGVLDETQNVLDEQEAMVETVYLNKYEVWRRVQHLPDAQKLYEKILSSGDRDDNAGSPTSYMHQVLSTKQINASGTSSSGPGGIVPLVTGPSYPTLGPQVAASLYPMHELTVWNDKLGDWTTIQIIAPDILITPKAGVKRSNIFCPETLCYNLVQANQTDGYIWGRSEIVDLMKLQEALTTGINDAKRCIGLVVDKLIGFSGESSIDDERFDQFRRSGYVNLGQGGDIKDMTPAFPNELLPYLKFILELMDLTSGFSGIMSGQGAPGVRSGAQTDTLMRTGSPRLRDRSLLVERQCAMTADTTLHALQAKDARQYWTDEEKIQETGFILAALPEDRRVMVDSHSSSPIYMQDHANLIFTGLKAGLVDQVSAIEDLPFSSKDLKIKRLKDAQKAKQAQIDQLMQKDPDAAIKLISGGRRK